MARSILRHFPHRGNRSPDLQPCAGEAGTKEDHDWVCDSDWCGLGDMDIVYGVGLERAETTERERTEEVF